VTRHLRARFAGTCSVCRLAYPKGTVLVGNRQGKGFAHLSCAMHARKQWYADRGLLPPEDRKRDAATMTDQEICHILGGTIVGRIGLTAPEQEELGL
jgi:hypothetical protein